MSLKNLARILCISLLGLGFIGCTHSIHNYHVSDQLPIDFKSGQVKKVSSNSEQFVILGFVRQTDYVNQAYASLESQCPSGNITGIHTNYSTSHGFFSWTNKISMTGYCVR